MSYSTYEDDYVNQAICERDKQQEGERLRRTIIATRLPGCETLEALASFYKLADSDQAARLAMALDEKARELLNSVQIVKF